MNTNNSGLDHKNYRQTKSDYFRDGFFYELWVDNGINSDITNIGERIARKYYDIGIYYCPLNSTNNSEHSIKLIKLDKGVSNNTKIKIDYTSILYSKKLLCDELNKKLSDKFLVGANLEGAHLEGINLDGKNLREVNLKGAKLEQAVLQRAFLKDSDLRDADLRDADLRNADLRGAKLRGADIRGALIDSTKASAQLMNISKDLKISSNVQLQKFNLSGGSQSESRFFKLVSVNGKEVDGGRYELPAKTKSGKVQTRGPKDKASVAFSEICQKNNKKDECTYKFAIQETTRGSNKKVYNYEGKREKLAKPIVLELKDKKTGKVKKVVKKYKNVIVAL